MRARRAIGIILGSVVLLATLAVVAVLVLVRTDWGREKVRAFAVEKLASVTHGYVSVGHVDGDLLHGLTLSRVVITDSARQPFVAIDTLTTKYALGSFFKKRISLFDVRLVHPVILLDRQPGGKWNYDRIFPRDSASGPSAPGFGSWITLKNVTLIDGTLTSRSPWKPNDTLSAHARDSVIKFTLGPMGRVNVERVPNGFQQIAIFRSLNGQLPFLQLADPDDKRWIIEVAHLSTVAQPMRPPTVTVTDAQGRFFVLGDSLYFSNAALKLSGSKATASGRYMISSNDLRLRLHADPLATNDLLWIEPNIPRDGLGATDFALDWVGPNSDYLATNARLAVGGATLRGSMGMVVNDTLTFHDTDLRFTRLDTRMIGKLFPTLQSPRQGYLSGRMAAAGGLGKVQLDGDVTFDDPISGRSRIIAKGAAGGDKNVFRAEDLHLTFTPVRVALGKIADPTLPVDGTVTGTAVLNGETTGRLNVTTDVTHHGSTGDSRITGTVAYGAASGTGRVPFINANLELQPLSLPTVGLFAPAAGLQGTIAGPVKIAGPMKNLTIDAHLTTPDSGSLVVMGTADFASAVKSYDVEAHTILFDAKSVSSKAPSTSLTADASVHGTGTTAETADAVASLTVRTSTYDSVTVDSAIVRASVANGLLTIDTLAAQLPGARATAAGTFGITAAQRGTLTYDVAIDSLGALSRFIPADTGTVEPRPGILAERVRKARADSTAAASAQDQAVARAVGGERVAIPKMAVDTPRAIAKSTIAGSAHVAGTLAGNVKTFDTKGTASGSHIVALGNSVDAVSARYEWDNALTPQSRLAAGVRAQGVLAAGFALDTVIATADYRNPSGSLDLQILQHDNRKYSVQAQYDLHSDRNEIRLANMQLKFDTTVYTTTQASVLHYGPSGLDIDRFEMRSPGGSSVLVMGSIPKVGDANLRATVVNFDVANVVTLLQSDVNARGLVSFDVAARGTSENPTIRGAFGATQFAYNSTAIPDVHGTLDYTNQTLTATVEANRAGRPAFLKANGTIPLNLALTTVVGSRIPKDRQIDARIYADSMPLAMIPEIPGVATNFGGVASADFTVKGTVNNPIADGTMSLRQAQVTVAANGVTYKNIGASLRFLRDTLVVDSIVGYADGRIRLVGGVGFANFAEPSFALLLTARKAKVLDDTLGMLHLTGTMNVHGPYKQVLAEGDIVITDGVIYVPEANGKTVIAAGDPALFAVVDTLSDRNRELFPTTSPIMKGLRADVGVSVNRDVFVRSRDVNVEVYTEDPVKISVDQSKRTLILDGTVLTDRGEYRFQGRRFQIRTGAATFVAIPDLNPTLQATAEYEVQLPGREAINIRIVIAGTLKSPRISLESDAQPPISQTDLLSYLAFGRTSSSLLQLSGSGLTSGGSGGSNIVGQGAALAARQVAAAALGAVTDEVAGEIAKSIKADQLTISPADVSLDAGSFLRGTQIEFGKYIQSRTFLGLQFRPDPQSLKRPGFQLTHRFGSKGYSVETSFEPRYLPKEPTLSPDQTPQTTSVFGLFFVREWRY